MNPKKTNNSLTDYILVFLLIATSGFQFFYVNEEWIVIGLLISIILLVKRNLIKKIDKQFLIVLTLFVFWELLQLLFLSELRIRSLLGTAGRLFFAYAIIKLVNVRFIDIYIKLIFFLTIISLFFYILFFIPDVTNILFKFGQTVFKPVFGLPADRQYPYTSNLLIFNFNGYEYLPPRNSGPFWEPGAFSIFLNIAIMFNVIVNGKLFSKKNLVFIVALITTISTAGFLVFFFISLSLLLVNKKYTYLKYLIAIPIILIFINAITSFEFLLPKIQESIFNAELTTTSRFGSALADYVLILKNPILGYGRSEQAIYGVNYFEISFMHRNNGLTKLFVQWGIIFALIFLYQIKKSFYHIVKQFRKPSSFALILFTSFILSAFSQGIFQYPFFMGLMFLQFVNFNQMNKLKTLEKAVR